LLRPRRARANSRSHGTLLRARVHRTHNACSYSRQSHEWKRNRGL